MTKTKQRRIGQFTVAGIGLGGMPLSMSSKPETPTEEEGIATVHAALDAGVNLIDTADIYAPAWDQTGHNERLIRKALDAWDGDKSSIVIASKGGITRSDGEKWGRNGSPEYLREAVERSLEALGLDRIDLYYWHRPDRRRLYSESVEALAQLKADGLISEIGISNANEEEIRLAIEVLGDGELAAVQNEFSPSFHHTSKRELDLCGRKGIAFLPWSPLGGTGGGASAVGERFPVLGEVADAHGVSPQQVTLAWELSLGDHVIPIPGASRPASIIDSFKALDLDLGDDELARINQAILGE